LRGRAAGGYAQTEDAAPAAGQGGNRSCAHPDPPHRLLAAKGFGSVFIS
jgi:hypothetical protein